MSLLAKAQHLLGNFLVLNDVKNRQIRSYSAKVGPRADRVGPSLIYLWNLQSTILPLPGSPLAGFPWANSYPFPGKFLKGRAFPFSPGLHSSVLLRDKHHASGHRTQRYIPSYFWASPSYTQPDRTPHHPVALCLFRSRCCLIENGSWSIGSAPP